MYPSVVCVMACGGPPKKPSRTIQARWAWWEICRSWAGARAGRHHSATRAPVFTRAAQEDQRLEPGCFPANVFISSCLEIVRLRYADAKHSESATKPRNLQDAAYRKLQGSLHRDGENGGSPWSVVSAN